MKSDTQKKTERMFTVPFIIVSLVNLIVSTTMQMFNSTVSLNLTGVLGYSSTISGTMISIGALAATITRFFGGRLCQRVGRKNLISFGLVLWGALTLLMGMAKDLSLLYPLRVVQMIGYSMASTATAVAIVDVLPKSRLSEGIGYYGLSMSIGQAVGPSVALAIYYNVSGAFLSVTKVILGLSLAILVCAFFLLNYEKEKQSADAEAQAAAPVSDARYTGIWKFVEKRALPAATCNLFVSFAGALPTLFLTLYAAKANILNAGLYFTLSVITMVLARLFSGKLSDTRGTLAAVIPGLLLTILGYILLIYSLQILPLFFVAGALNGFGNGLIAPALNAAAVRSVEKDRISIASSTYSLPIDVSFMVAAIVWGAFIDFMEFKYIFLIASCFYVCALILSIYIFHSELRVSKQLQNNPKECFQ